MQFLNNNQVTEFLKETAGEPVFIYPIVNDTKKHWTENTIDGIYFRKFRDLREFYINYKHYDAEKNESIVGQNYAKSNDVVYKSKLFGTGIDCEILYWVWNNLKIPGHQYNCFTPLYKIIEHAQDVFNTVIGLQDKINDSATIGYNNFLKNLSIIERNGLYTDSGMEYTEYNIFTTTGRPSNAFNGINYAALNKTDGSRNRFTSRFESGWLFEFDYHAYHVHLLAKLLKHEFKNPNDVYGELSKEMNLSIEDTKAQVFQQMYGGVKAQYKNIDFFAKLSMFLFKLENSQQTYDSLTTSFLYKKNLYDPKNCFN